MSHQSALIADEEPLILLKLTDGVGRILLNREHKLNSLNAELESQLLSALEACEADDSVRSIVIAGAATTSARVRTSRRCLPRSTTSSAT